MLISEELNKRLKSFEEELEKLRPLPDLVKQLQSELAEAKKQLNEWKSSPSNNEAAHHAPSTSTRRRASTNAAGQQAAMIQAQAAALASQTNSSKARTRTAAAPAPNGKTWGFLDILNFGQGTATSTTASANATAGASAASALTKRTTSAAPAAKLPPPSDALAVLQNAISAIEVHFQQAAVAGSSKTMDVLGNDQKNKEIAVLVRGQLCTALSRVMLHGFKSFKMIGRYHIWDFVQQSCDATHTRLQKASEQYSDAERTLTDAVVQVNSLSSGDGPVNNPNIKFRSFVCSGLNNGLIHEWIRVLTSDGETMGKFYETWAFVRHSEDALPQMTSALQPLAQYKYTLSLDYEISRWDLH